MRLHIKSKQIHADYQGFVANGGLRVARSPPLRHVRPISEVSPSPIRAWFAHGTRMVCAWIVLHLWWFACFFHEVAWITWICLFFEWNWLDYAGFVFFLCEVAWIMHGFACFLHEIAWVMHGFVWFFMRSCMDYARICLIFYAKLHGLCMDLLAFYVKLHGLRMDLLVLLCEIAWIIRQKIVDYCRRLQNTMKLFRILCNTTMKLWRLFWKAAENCGLVLSYTSKAWTWHVFVIGYILDFFWRMVCAWNGWPKTWLSTTMVARDNSIYCIYNI